MPLIYFHNRENVVYYLIRGKSSWNLLSRRESQVCLNGMPCKGCDQQHTEDFIAKYICQIYSPFQILLYFIVFAGGKCLVCVCLASPSPPRVFLAPILIVLKSP